jgi:spore maturation protein CgeB
MPNDHSPVPARRLKVLVIGNGTLDCASTNCVIALRAMGHDADYFDPEEHPKALGAIRKSWEAKRYVNRVLDAAGLTRKLYERALIRTVEATAPDLVIVVPLYAVSARAVAAMKERSRAKITGWYQDHMANFGAHEFMLAPYDALFFKDPYIVERLREHGGITNIHLLPESCEPSVHHPLPLTDDDRARYGCDLMVYGNLYPYRARILEHVATQDLRIYGLAPGPWFTHPIRARAEGRPIFRDEKIRATLAAKIVLNSCHYAEVRSANARLFEVAGIGGFQLSDAPGAPDFFEPGVEIATFRGPNELREAIAYYLARPGERAKIAAAGQRRAHRDHTYAKRLARLIGVVGLDAKQPAEHAEASP